MPNWIFYGLIAFVCFAVNTVIFKIAQQRGNFSPYYGALLFGIGAIFLFGLFFIFKPSFSLGWKSSGLVIIAGMIWAIGFLSIAVAIAQNADVARLAPIYNANTLLVVLLGIIFLKEIPDASQIFRVIAGAVLIVIGAVLVSV